MGVKAFPNRLKRTSGASLNQLVPARRNRLMVGVECWFEGSWTISVQLDGALSGGSMVRYLPALQPPSMTNSLPVMNDASSLAR